MTENPDEGRKSRLRAVVFGGGYGYFPPLMEKFKQEFEIVDVINHIDKVSMMYRLLFLIISFRLPKQAWYRKWKHYLEKTPFSFRFQTRLNEMRLRSLAGEYDILIFFGAMSAPGVLSDKPLFLITDSTRSLSSRNAFDVTSHFSGDEERREWLTLEGGVYQAARLIFVGSNFVKKSLICDYGIQAERVIVTGFGAGLGHAEEYDKHFDGKTILYVGKGDFEKKGGQVLIDAFAMVRDEIPDAVLHIVGQERIPNIAGIVNHGFVTDRKLLCDLMKAAHVFVLPSLVDRFGIVLVEAMAASTPCIASDYGAMPEVVGDAGLIVRQNDAQELAQALIRVLRDEELARMLGRNGRQRFKDKYNWNAIWDVMRSEIRKAVEISQRVDA